MNDDILKNISLNIWIWYFFYKGIAWNLDFSGLSSKYSVYFRDRQFYTGKQENISNKTDWKSTIGDESVLGRLRIE